MPIFRGCQFSSSWDIGPAGLQNRCYGPVIYVRKFSVHASLHMHAVIRTVSVAFKGIKTACSPCIMYTRCACMFNNVILCSSNTTSRYRVAVGAYFAVKFPRHVRSCTCHDSGIQGVARRTADDRVLCRHVSSGVGNTLDTVAADGTVRELITQAIHQLWVRSCRLPFHEQQIRCWP